MIKVLSMTSSRATEDLGACDVTWKLRGTCSWHPPSSTRPSLGIYSEASDTTGTHCSTTRRRDVNTSERPTKGTQSNMETHGTAVGPQQTYTELRMYRQGTYRRPSSGRPKPPKWHSIAAEQQYHPHQPQKTHRATTYLVQGPLLCFDWLIAGLSVYFWLAWDPYKVIKIQSIQKYT